MSASYGETVSYASLHIHRLILKTPIYDCTDPPFLDYADHPSIILCLPFPVLPPTEEVFPRGEEGSSPLEHLHHSVPPDIFIIKQSLVLLCNTTHIFVRKRYETSRKCLVSIKPLWPLLLAADEV